MDRQQLAHFLRSKREKLRPDEVGLPTGERRRTPGLRRQEVAQLAGMSVEYYIRLEQSRSPHPSAQILLALSRALLLSMDERSHLFHLAGLWPPPQRSPQALSSGVKTFLMGLDHFPAYAVDEHYDLQTWNELALEFLPYLSSVTDEQPNLLVALFCAPDSPQRLAERGNLELARSCVADLRASFARRPHDERMRIIVDQLQRDSPEFHQLWGEHEVAVRRAMIKTIRHPRVGEVEVECLILHVPDSDLRLVVYVTAADSPSRRAMDRLHEWSLSPQ